MAFNPGKYYQDLFTQLLSKNAKLNVGANFHAQVKNINKILRNDTTGMICTIIDFMVQCATVPINFESKNVNLNSIFNDWKENINSDVNIDIPRGLRSFTEQYFRERWKSSFIVLNIQWGKIDGYTMPVNMWFSDGGQVYVDHNDSDLTTTKYYLGPKKTKPSNEITTTQKKTVIIRKPYSSWYDKYPSPYLVKKGAMYHALLKQLIIEKQAQGVQQVFPAMLAIKVGSDEAMRQQGMPTEPELKDIKKKFTDLKEDEESRTANNGLVGAYPYDVNFENLLPDFLKILDEKITSGIDRNLLMALGLIEFKGFSTNREEAVLNPKPLISEIEDGVKDYLELISDIIYEIKKKNVSAKKFSSKDISISSQPIQILLTDSMKALIRSLYDRGLVSKQDTIEGTTAYKFDQQVEKRKSELKDNLDKIMQAPVILNQDNKDTSDNRNDDDSNQNQTPQQKKSEKDVDAKIKGLKKAQKAIFLDAFDKCTKECERLEFDEEFAFVTAIEFADEALKKYTKVAKKKATKKSVKK